MNSLNWIFICQLASFKLDFGIFQYCGMKVTAHLNFERADRATAEQIEVLQSAVKDIYQESVLLLSLQE